MVFADDLSLEVVISHAWRLSKIDLYVEVFVFTEFDWLLLEELVVLLLQFVLVHRVVFIALLLVECEI